MTKADSRSSKGGKLLPPAITDPKNVEMLRDLTTELEMKIERALRSLFTSSVMPWEQWFINAISNPDNRASLGIPNNLEKIDISHLMGGREGFHETFRRTNLERLGIIISESLRTIVCHPLAGSGLNHYAKTVETLSAELLRELRWNEFDGSLKHMISNKLEILVKDKLHTLFDAINNIVERYNDNQDGEFKVKTNIDEDECKERVTECILKLMEVIDDQTDAADACFSPFLSEINVDLSKENQSGVAYPKAKDEEQSQIQTEIVNVLIDILNESSESIEKIDWKDIEELTYGYWHSYKDPAMNVVLDTLTRARYDKTILSNRYACKVIDSLVDGYVASVGVNSCLTLLWLCSVVTYSSHGAEKQLDLILKNHYSEPVEDSKNACLSHTEPFLHNKKRVLESLGVLQEFKDKQYIKRVIAVPGAIEVCAFINAKSDDEHIKILPSEFKQGLDALLENVLCINNRTHDGQKPLKESDWGHLYFMCNKLDALYSFWIWYHADLLTHQRHTLHKIGKYWYSDIVYNKVEKIIKEKEFFADKCDLEETLFEKLFEEIGNGYQLTPQVVDAQRTALIEDQRNTDHCICKKVWKGKRRIKGTEQSVFLLGGAGFGKTELLKQIYTHKDDAPVTEERTSSEANQDVNTSSQSIPAKMIQLTPLSFVKTCDFSNTLKEYTSDLVYHHKCVIFIDELHIETQPSIYALLLVPLGEGVKNSRSDAKPIIPICGLDEPYDKCEWIDNNELNIHFVFASSRYQTKRVFLEEAFITKNTAMRDFSTRVQHWIELPGFHLVPEQKLALDGLVFRKTGICEEMIGNKKNEPTDITLTVPMNAISVDIMKKFLDLSISSTREFMANKDPHVIRDRLNGANGVERQNSYPGWLWSHMEEQFNGK
ncbi:MAG: hypothetical protein PHY48_08825 [Candidatus Cloacimonetes bacterium]|nr:hypothetical protein [Candidatus Cloacimonadota bacterium]